MSKQFLIPESLGNELLQYLATKPYAEVYKLVGGLQRMEEYGPIEDEDLDEQ
jgi:hypothetical protein